MKKMSLFKNLVKDIGRQSLPQTIKEIRRNRHKAVVLEIRELVSIGDHEKGDKLKEKLVTFTVSGLFKGEPKVQFLEAYNPFVMLNFNNLDPEVLPYLFLKIKEIAFTKVVYKSLDGRGLEVIVEVNTEFKKHSLAYYQVCDFYEKELAIEVEKNGSSVTQLCYMSYDPEAFFNAESKVFEVKVPKTAEGSSFSMKILEATTEVPSESETGETAPPEENLKDTDKSNATGVPKKTRRISVSYPPAIPLKIYSKLPALLKKSCHPFKDYPHRRGAFLTGALGVLSGLIPGISGMYNGHLLYPNLFVFVIAPDTGHEGTFKFTKYLAEACQDKLMKANKNQLAKYQYALANFEHENRNYNTGTSIKKPEFPNKPQYKNLFPASPMNLFNLLEYFDKNEGSGILFESEGDNPEGFKDQDWNGFSDLLRKAYGHEALLYGRRFNENQVSVDCPKLSVVLSKTINQMSGWVPVLGDSLLSRFMFYTYEVDESWQEASGKKSSPNLRMTYENLSEDVRRVVDFLQVYPAEFTMTQTQWKTLNSVFAKMMKQTVKEYGSAGAVVVRRMGMSCFRMAMVLSALRRYEEKRLGKKLVCNDNDFKAAIWLSEAYLKHGLFMVKTLDRFRM